jgi:hypothetical protein
MEGFRDVRSTMNLPYSLEVQVRDDTKSPKNDTVLEAQVTLVAIRLRGFTASNYKARRDTAPDRGGVPKSHMAELE